MNNTSKFLSVGFIYMSDNYLKLLIGEISSHYLNYRKYGNYEKCGEVIICRKGTIFLL